MGYLQLGPILFIGLEVINTHLIWGPVIYIINAKLLMINFTYLHHQKKMVKLSFMKVQQKGLIKINLYKFLAEKHSLIFWININ